MTSQNPLAEPPPSMSDSMLAAVLQDGWDLAPARQGRQTPAARSADGSPQIALQRFASEQDITALVDDRYFLKVSNPAVSPELIDLEIKAMAHLARYCDVEVPRTVPARDGDLMRTIEGEDGRRSFARLITRVSGSALEGTPITIDRAEAIGVLAARINRGLAGFFHPAAGRDVDWDPRHATALYGRQPDLDLSDLSEIAERVADLPERTAALPSAVQHGDLTLTNLLSDGPVVAGTAIAVVDFGDMNHSADVCDLAIALTSVLRNTSKIQVEGTWDLARAVIDGYQSIRPLSPDEVDVLGELVLARLLVTVVITRQRASVAGVDQIYAGQWDESSRTLLRGLAALSQAELADRLHGIAGTRRSPRRQARRPQTQGELRSRRARALGGAISPLFYREPLVIDRGQGPWLYDPDGVAYLDAYNNVAVVGHSHPAVTAAVTEQLRVLNTHSRYLHPGIVELAERLVATLPPELDSCLFTPSGTEANELAWRFATEYTGGDGAIIVEHAYHGSTKWMADLSSNEWPRGHVPGPVATIKAPSGPHDPVTQAQAAERVVAAAETLQRRGHKPALVLVDPGFTSEGIRDAPAAYLRGIAAGARQVGALFLADEVQSGYGRSGTHFWRHASADFTPDIVTIGKPMGAGYPIGATITSRAITDRLAARYEYFSTFAGTAVAAAAANAVLDVITERSLVAAAGAIGKQLRDGVSAIAERHSMLGEVRGTGLICGVDLFPAETRAPKPLAAQFLENLKRNGVLAGLTGPQGTVLKIRPPLIWTSEHVTHFLDTLESTVITGW
ncbi:MAG TPA: aminotransferase class III-fold pyridoxal phosphate-dependent enzyme [Streptosporangiaceae bacterium]|nr:aminotransferase class III-fold pyridoxal phosphate-dependent enzyme [Streptosporangiaceae bacterium]